MTKVIYKIIDAADKSLIGRYLIDLEEGVMVLATPTLPQHFTSRYNLQTSKSEPLPLIEEKWLHPHLYKKIKQEISKIIE